MADITVQSSIGGTSGANAPRVSFKFCNFGYLKSILNESSKIS
jgi:hypothetical protein